MPNENDQSNPKDPGAGAGGSAGAGSGGGAGTGAGAAKGTGSRGGATPDNNDKPPQAQIIAAAAVGGLGLVGTLIGTNLRP